MKHSTQCSSLYTINKKIKSRVILLVKPCFLVFSVVLYFPVSAQLVRNASGVDVAAIQSSVDAFRLDLGTLNANVAGSFGTGRREINWDGVPDALAAPNNLPANFFNVNSPRGAVFTTPGTGFQVSANNSNPSSTPIEFGNIDPSYSSIFATFSPQRLFTALGSNIMDVNFFVPGSSTPALVRGFGAVFSDVDLTNTTSIQFFDQNSVTLGTFFVPAFFGSETFSFLGVSYTNPVISRVRLTSGNGILSAGTIENLVDLVVMDDFIYGEPVDATALPITFTTIKAYQKNRGIEVEWNIATESNMEEYQVEKSSDGATFIKGGSRAAASNNNSSITYRWFDAQPNNGINYYRIKTIAIGGEIKYSQVVKVNTGIGKGSITIYPNPLKGYSLSLQLTNKTKGNYSLSLYNYAGQTSFTKMISHGGGSATETIQLPGTLSNGIYQLEIKGENGSNESIKLVVNN